MKNTINKNKIHWTITVKQIQQKYNLKSFKDAKNKWLELKQKVGSINKINVKKYQQLEKLINKFVNELSILKQNKNDYEKELLGGSKLAKFFTGLTKGLQALGKIPNIFKGLNNASKLLARIIR